MIRMLDDKKTTAVRMHNHPMLPLEVYDFYRETIPHNPRFARFDRDKPISRNKWAWVVIECKEYVIRSLHLSDNDEIDILRYENNTIEVFLYCLFLMDRYTFEEGAVPDDFRRE